MNRPRPAAAAAPAPLVYIGSAVRAAGYRLAGFATVTPRDGQEGGDAGDSTAMEQAMRGAAVVVIEAEIAERLPRGRIEKWLAAGTPLVVIAPRSDGSLSTHDPAERVRVQLGMEA